jgi:hypothetical protein
MAAAQQWAESLVQIALGDVRRAFLADVGGMGIESELLDLLAEVAELQRWNLERIEEAAIRTTSL